MLGANCNSPTTGRRRANLLVISRSSPCPPTMRSAKRSVHPYLAAGNPVEKSTWPHYGADRTNGSAGIFRFRQAPVRIDKISPYDFKLNGRRELCVLGSSFVSWFPIAFLTTLAIVPVFRVVFSVARAKDLIFEKGAVSEENRRLFCIGQFPIKHFAILGSGRSCKLPEAAIVFAKRMPCGLMTEGCERNFFPTFIGMRKSLRKRESCVLAAQRRSLR